MLTNGSTAMECGGGLKALGDAAGDDVALVVAKIPGGFGIHGLLMSAYASVATTSTPTATGKARLHGGGRPVVKGIGDEPENASASDRAVVGGSGDSRRL